MINGKLCFPYKFRMRHVNSIADYMEFSIKEIDYSMVLPMWRNELWPDRQDPIRPMSSMQLGGGINMEIYKRFTPVFSGLYSGETLAGVISGHPVSEQEFRIRGLYIKSEFRGRGGSQKLFENMKKAAIQRGCSLIWSYPRLSALPVYLKFGFQVHPSEDHDSDHVYVFLNAVI